VLKSLLSDPIVRLVVAIWAVVTALYLAPILPHDRLVYFSDEILDLPFLPWTIVAIWFGLRRIEDDIERRFWRFMGASFCALLAVSVPYVIVSSFGEWTTGWKIYADLAYLMSYLFQILAIESQPHRRHTGSLGDRERQLRTFGIIVFGFFLLGYFVLVPATFNGASYETSVPSFYLFVGLDIAIIIRLLWNRRDSWSVRWTWLYTWLVVAASFVFVGDVFELTTSVAGVDLPSATMLDLIWTTPLALFAIAVRARHVEFPAEQRVLNEVVLSRGPLRAGHVLLAGALMLPVLHLLITLVGALDPETRQIREIVSVLSLVAMGMLALIAYRVLERDREQMEAKELRLVNELGVARKMDAVARLAASVAHDFNNLIHIIHGRSDILAEQLTDDDPLHEEIREIRAAAARATDLAGQLMAFGRTQPTSPATVSLHELLGRAEQLLKPLLDERTRLSVIKRATHDVVRVDPLQFERVMLNLVTNARDAMPTGGSVIIETSNPGFESLGGHPYSDRSLIFLTVKDTGLGMERGTVEHIFEPFFTTKEGRGAGLGLAITHGLIQQMGGSISVESQVGAGTTFRITLPVVRNVEPSPVGAIAGKNQVVGAVLIIEMDPTNRQLLRRLLADLERPVLTAATGPEALLVANRYPGPVDLAVVDVTCEGGRTITAQLRETQTTMRALLLAQDQPIDPSEEDVLLREPFELTDVLRIARRLLMDRPQG
jgi:signal transduction histidine kinase/CheY-like chemotaxis protein